MCHIRILAHLLVYMSAQDPYGNYVVGYVLDMSNPRFSDAIIRQFLAHVCHLAMQKFSSNVIEKVLYMTARRSHEPL